MNQQEIELAKKLQFDPAVLFLGQSYLSTGSKQDTFLSQILSKWSISAEHTSYSSLFNISEQNKTAVREWSQKLSDSISIPDNLAVIANFPWSHIYTSAIDSIVYRAFKNDSRTVQPVYDQLYRLTDPRSRVQLHETFLFGQIQHSDNERKAPLSKFELTQRNLIATILLNRLPSDIVTPKGVLLIDGWKPEYDWLTSEILYSVAVKFGESQIHIFSASNVVQNDEYIRELVRTKKIILHNSSLATYIERATSEGFLDISKISADQDGTWIFLGEKRIKIPDTIKRKISKTAIVLHPQLFEYRNDISEEDITHEFRNFISYSTTIPKWEGYSKGFAFRRNFIDSLKNKINNFSERSDVDEPIILAGQGSSGKTIGLGAVAYDFIQNKKGKLAFLFFERSYRRLDENAIKNIDDFCIWAEDNGAVKTVLLYDGMHAPDMYQSILKKLTSRGRKVILVGSVYLNNEPIENAIHATIQLEQDEKNRFASYIKDFIENKPILEQIIKSSSDQNFLSILYHYLPESKSNINSLIRSEAKFVSQSFTQVNQQSETHAKLLKNLLLELGFTESEKDVDDFGKEMDIGGETATLAAHFVNMIMVIGKLGFAVPFELVIRSLGTDSVKAGFFKNIPNTDLIRWYEDHNGNISVGPRTSLEARIYCYSLGGLDTEVHFINKILKQIRDSSSSLQEDREIEFATLLLQVVKSEESQFRPYLHKFAETLTELRKSKQAYHPRLMLQEAALYQECVKNEENLPSGTTPLDILTIAEEVVLEALEIESNSNTSTRKFLKVELASITGSMGYQLSKTDPSEAQILFTEARHNILKSGFTVENYHALDILLWTIKHQASISTNDIEKIDLYVEALHYIQYAEEEGVASSRVVKFNERKMEVGRIFGDIHLSEQAFNDLKEKGSKVGYYIRAIEKLEGIDLGSLAAISGFELKLVDSALSYLRSNFDHIKDDSKCLYLVLKLWWLYKTKSSIFSEEKKPIQFPRKDWQFLSMLTDLLIHTSEDFLLPSLLYLNGLAQFHLDEISGAMGTFNQLSELSENSNVGSRRIIKYYMSGNEDGSARLYTGIIDRPIDAQNKTGLVLVESINKKIRIFYGDFRRTLKKGDVVEFYIGFNFIGPVASPIR